MIELRVNGRKRSYKGSGETSLLFYLREILNITSAKDGCSGEGVCGACTLEVDGRPKLACRLKMKNLNGSGVITTEGLPESFREMIGRLFAENGAVQCGFCTPGFIMRTRKLFKKKTSPSRGEIIRAVNPNLCRCTGYVKIVDAIEAALKENRDGKGDKKPPGTVWAGIGTPLPKYDSALTALGSRPFVNDLFPKDLAHGALRFSDHPKARIKAIDISGAVEMEGVIRVFTAEDIPGERYNGLIFNDWPLMVAKGETTRYIGDVLAGVVATDRETAKRAAGMIRVDYEVLKGVFTAEDAAAEDSPRVHPEKSNILEICSLHSGNPDKEFSNASWVASAVYHTPHIEHAFMECEAAVAMPEGRGVRIYSQGQGIYEDRAQIARILNVSENRVRVSLLPSGGGFGGKEDLSVQGHTALFAWLLKRPVKLSLDRQESIRMHPKRHPVRMEIKLACNKEGKFTALKLEATGDTGAYASVGTKVMERIVGHATGAYVIPAADIKAKTVYTNNIPSGAMRGFGVPQIIFALESCIDDLCSKAGFDRWQIRYDNALEEGSRTAAGQRLEGVGLKKTLLAVKEDFHQARYAGIACAIKNSGVGNSMVDQSSVIIKILPKARVEIHHGWTEMGQGIDTVAIQCLNQETGIDPGRIDVIVDTRAGIPTGMTTSSRGTALLGNAILDAASRLRSDLKAAGNDIEKTLKSLAGRVYRGKYVCDWTCRPGENRDDPKIHFAYGYATQVAILDKEGKLKKVVAAHDAGRVINPVLFQGQIEGSVHMGVGYALKEKLPVKNGWPESFRMKDLGILRAVDMPRVKVIAVEEKDPHGPYGAKGVGEIGIVPTAAAVANAYFAFDGVKRTRLPLDTRTGSK